MLPEMFYEDLETVYRLNKDRSMWPVMEDLRDLTGNVSPTDEELGRALVRYRVLTEKTFLPIVET